MGRYIHGLIVAATVAITAHVALGHIGEVAQADHVHHYNPIEIVVPIETEGPIESQAPIETAVPTAYPYTKSYPPVGDLLPSPEPLYTVYPHTHVLPDFNMKMKWKPVATESPVESYGPIFAITPEPEPLPEPPVTVYTPEQKPPVVYTTPEPKPIVGTAPVYVTPEPRAPNMYNDPSNVYSCWNESINYGKKTGLRCCMGQYKCRKDPECYDHYDCIGKYSSYCQVKKCRTIMI